LLALVEALIGAPADEGLSTDELMGVTGLGSEKLRAPCTISSAWGSPATTRR
jgi:hypothetical protein